MLIGTISPSQRARSVKSTLMPNEERYEVYIRRELSTQVAVEECWTENSGGLGGHFHRIGAPAVILRDAMTGTCIQEEWYLHGKRHREGGPAVVRRAIDGKIKYTSWFHHGELVPHRKRGKSAVQTPMPRQ